MAPITSEEVEEVYDYEVFIEANKETGLDYPSKILLQRVRAVKKELRLIKHLGTIKQEIINQIKKGLKIVLDLED